MFLFESSLTVILSMVWAIYVALSQFLVVGLHLPVSVAGFLTRAVAIAFLTVAIVLRREGRDLIRPGKQVRYALLIGIINCGMNLAALVGLKYTTVTNGTVITKLDVLFTLLASRFILKERMHLPDWIGLTVMALGTVLLMWQNIVNFSANLAGDLLFVMVALCLTLNAFIVKYRLAETPNGVIATYNTFVTCLGFWCFALISGHIRQLAFFVTDGTTFLAATATGVSVAVLFLLYYRALGRLPFWLVRVLLLFIPVFGLLIDRIFLKRAILLNSIIGMAAVVGGAALIIIYHDKRKRRSVHAD